MAIGWHNVHISPPMGPSSAVLRGHGKVSRVAAGRGGSSREEDRDRGEPRVRVGRIISVGLW